ncbi:hypothetical protein PAXRUDRAFT_22351 [Paxillus rubicundulus Ve08.2h10]|uniref:Uncharacterized protein n=1 Tax=Paxillus rubicundulus Ve08.2h10 TaxID=930991 RepID=A0A0D0BKE1_9AGAM|nr:hypothetical protein PAXRUDRAFT_22351 [Paxillus rubicundulus Ve08.2h10]
MTVTSPLVVTRAEKPDEEPHPFDISVGLRWGQRPFTLTVDDSFALQLRVVPGPYQNKTSWKQVFYRFAELQISDRRSTRN